MGTDADATFPEHVGAGDTVSMGVGDDCIPDRKADVALDPIEKGGGHSLSPGGIDERHAVSVTHHEAVRREARSVGIRVVRGVDPDAGSEGIELDRRVGPRRVALGTCEVRVDQKDKGDGK